MYVSNFGPKRPKNTAKVTACAVTFSVTFGLVMQESLPCVLRQLLGAGLYRVEYRNDKVRDVILGRLGRQLPDALGDALDQGLAHLLFHEFLDPVEFVDGVLPEVDPLESQDRTLTYRRDDGARDDGVKHTRRDVDARDRLERLVPSGISPM